MPRDLNDDLKNSSERVYRTDRQREKTEALAGEARFVRAY